jgi:hypothetical protein
MLAPIKIGGNQPATSAVVAVPASPSRPRKPAVVQVGAAPATARRAPATFRKKVLMGLHPILDAGGFDTSLKR